MDGNQIKHMNLKKFKLKSNKNGIILTIHNTINTDNGEIKRIRFSNVCFNNSNNIIAAIDYRGNIFVFNINLSKFWVLPEKIIKCKVIKFFPTRNDVILLGTKDGNLIEMDTSNGHILFNIKLYDSPIIDITFPSLLVNIFISVATNEAYIHDAGTFAVKHKLKLDNTNIKIITICSIPDSHNIFGCFSDDSIHIWSDSNFRHLRQIYPFREREKYLKKSKANVLDFPSCPEIGINDEVIPVPLGETNKIPNCMDNLIKNITKDYSKGRIISVCFTTTGKYLCMCTVDYNIIIFSTLSFAITNVISTKSITIKQCKYLPEFIDEDGNSRLILILLTEQGDCYMIDTDNLTVKLCMSTATITRYCIKFNISKNGKMLAQILNTGEIFIYNVDLFLKLIQRQDKYIATAIELKDDGKLLANMKLEIRKEQIYNEIKTILPRSRLLAILKEYGEYPGKFRHIIWRTILQLPENNNSFIELLKKGEHSCVANFDKLYPLKDISALRNLKKIVSCLSFLSKVFGEIDYLPRFVFPFLQIYPREINLCFETVATILLNQCQLWFEFAPMEPYNYLGMIENVLGELEPNLMRFYCERKITTKIYAFALMENAMSEVFDENQWLQLWDNIVSNQPYYFLFCIVAYNIIQKNVIMKLDGHHSIEQFFHDQSNIEFKKFIDKTYELMEKTCPPHLHPKQYIKNFEPLVKGQYQYFTNYPKHLINSKHTEIDSLRMENKVINAKMRELEKAEVNLSERLEKNLKAEEHEKRMKEVEKQYQEALLREEERVSYQRKMLLLYQRQMRDRESQILEQARNSVMRKTAMARESELDLLLSNLERNRIREETDILFAEEDLKLQELELMMKKYNIDMQNVDTMAGGKDDNQSLETRYKNVIEQLKTQRKKLMDELKNIRDKTMKTSSGDSDDKSSYLSKRINEIEGMLYRMSCHCDEMKTKSTTPTSSATSTTLVPSSEYRYKVKKLERRTSELESELQKLLYRE